MPREASQTKAVRFSRNVESCREPWDDERSVMTHFAKHAGRCDICADPYEAYRRDTPFCDKGHALAMDVANYIYGKGGKPFSIIDKKQEGDSVRLEVPAGCEVINNLCKAFCKGMTLKKREKREKPVPKAPHVVSPEFRGDQEEGIVDGQPRKPRDRNVYVVEITPSPSRPGAREKVYYYDISQRRDGPRPTRYTGRNSSSVFEQDGGHSRQQSSGGYRRRTDEGDYYENHQQRPKSKDRKGSLYDQDEEERRRRKAYYKNRPIVIVTETRRHIQR